MLTSVEGMYRDGKVELAVRRVVEAVAAYPNREELRQEYPELDDADIRQALEYAAANLDDKTMPLAAAL